MALADVYTGIHEVAAVNAALLGRMAGGRGQHVRFSGYEPAVPPVAPPIGRHNRDVAASLGYSGEEIEALAGDGVLYEEEAAAQSTAEG